MLVELSVMERRYHAVMEVISGARVTTGASRAGKARTRLWLTEDRDGLHVDHGWGTGVDWHTTRFGLRC